MKNVSKTNCLKNFIHRVLTLNEITNDSVANPHFQAESNATNDSVETLNAAWFVCDLFKVCKNMQSVS